MVSLINRSADCSFEGDIHQHGQTFPSKRDRCVVCQCDTGSVKCHSKACPPVTCSQPRPVPGQCCPVCDEPSCEFEGRHYDDGHVVPLPSRPCEECHCQDGQVQCSRLPCPRVNCAYPLPGTCCPTCEGRPMCYYHLL